MRVLLFTRQTKFLDLKVFKGKTFFIMPESWPWRPGPYKPETVSCFKLNTLTDFFLTAADTSAWFSWHKTLKGNGRSHYWQHTILSFSKYIYILLYSTHHYFLASTFPMQLHTDCWELQHLSNADNVRFNNRLWVCWEGEDKIHTLQNYQFVITINNILWHLTCCFSSSKHFANIN